MCRGRFFGLVPVFPLTSLTASNLCFSYESGQPVLSWLNFEAKPGRILGLVGANGSGKSTLVNILGGILTPTAGELSLGEVRGRLVKKILRKDTALMPQNVDHWLLGETGAEDLKLGLDLADPETAGLLAELVERWGLGEILNRPVESLSLGWKKRIALVAALVRRPVAIFLDEPLAGLDWPGVKAMLLDLTRLKQAGVIIILSTHEPELVAPLTDEWLLLKADGEYLWGTGPQIFSRFEEFGIRPFLRP